MCEVGGGTARARGEKLQIRTRTLGVGEGGAVKNWAPPITIEASN